MKRRSVWFVEERHWHERKGWGPWSICSPWHTSEGLARQTVSEVKTKTIVKYGHAAFVLGYPFEFRVMRYDANDSVKAGNKSLT